MQRRYNLVHFILASIVAWGLTMLMVGVDAHAQIAFASNRDGQHKIYVMGTEQSEGTLCTFRICSVGNSLTMRI